MPQTGTVKFFNHAKGFGFITPEEGEKDVFVHISAVQASGLTGLEDGQKVTFETGQARQGSKSGQSLGRLNRPICDCRSQPVPD